MRSFSETKYHLLIILLCVLAFTCCSNRDSKPPSGVQTDHLAPEAKELADMLKTAATPIFKVGAELTSTYTPFLKGQRIGVVVNQSSLIGSTHLIDTLLSLGLDVKRIFAPEHGFRGTADAGEHVSNEKDAKTGLPVISLYGTNKKPTAEQVKDLDVLIYDIQDVGARFYTYISTMHYIMEACAENNKECVIFDRPNPNGDYVAGPVLEPEFSSFVGMHPIPIVYGMTPGELAKMINSEGWLAGGSKCDLKVIKMENYTHDMKYELPVKPSPNLPNYQSIRLYPTLCLFEPTEASIGRGTHFPFQVLGSPKNEDGFCFTPKSIDGMSKNPKHLNTKCCGVDLRNIDSPTFSIDWLVDYYKKYGDDSFITSSSFFNKLAGTDLIQKGLKAGKTAKEIEAEWQPALEKFKTLRKQYLLYP